MSTISSPASTLARRTGTEPGLQANGRTALCATVWLILINLWRRPRPSATRSQPSLQAQLNDPTCHSVLIFRPLVIQYFYQQPDVDYHCTTDLMDLVHPIWPESDSPDGGRSLDDRHAECADPLPERLQVLDCPERVSPDSLSTHIRGNPLKAARRDAWSPLLASVIPLCVSASSSLSFSTAPWITA
jgi:hypothetical protein